MQHLHLFVCNYQTVEMYFNVRQTIVIVFVIYANFFGIMHFRLSCQYRDIGVVVKVTDSHPRGWGSIPDKSSSFLICSNQHVKYWMLCGFPKSKDYVCGSCGTLSSTPHKVPQLLQTVRILGFPWLAVCYWST